MDVFTYSYYVRSNRAVETRARAAAVHMPLPSSPARTARQQQGSDAYLARTAPHAGRARARQKEGFVRGLVALLGGTRGLQTPTSAALWLWQPLPAAPAAAGT